VQAWQKGWKRVERDSRRYELKFVLNEQIKLVILFLFLFLLLTVLPVPIKAAATKLGLKVHEIDNFKGWIVWDITPIA
jgi:hypothetical protein